VRPWLISLVVHICVLTGVCLLLTGMLWGPQPDANIGAGLVQLLLAGLGMPWSLLTFSGVLPEQRDYVETLELLSFALVNLLLHGALALVSTRRTRRSPESVERPGPVG